MATKQELEAQVVELTRQRDELLRAQATADLSGGSDLPLPDDSIIHTLRSEIIDLKQVNSRLTADLADVTSKRDLAEELLKKERLLRTESPDQRKQGDLVLRIMQAWELVDLVKYQYLAKDAEVAVLKKKDD